MSPERQLVQLFRRAFEVSCETGDMRRGTRCSCGNPARDGARDCTDCHAAAQRRYRARQRAERERTSPLAALVARHCTPKGPA